MRAVMARPAALFAALVIVSCATSKPASVPEWGADSTAAVDSSSSMAEGLFVERHASVLAELASREAGAPADLRLMEARSFVSAAEETYLRGSTLLALEILERAEKILRQRQ